MKEPSLNEWKHCLIYATTAQSVLQILVPEFYTSVEHSVVSQREGSH
jgi:hypothetical protein